MGRNSGLLAQVKESLVEVRETTGNAHEILVGDVSDAAFWERMKKEVSLIHLSFRFKVYAGDQV